MIDFGIIAAGDGNRIKQEGSLLPKPLVNIQGKPMILRLLDIMVSNNPRSISIIVNSDMPEVIKFLNDYRTNSNIPVNLLDRKTESSMHTFHELMKLMKPKGKFVVTTVDTIFRENDFRSYVDALENAAPQINGIMGVTDYIDDEKPLYVKTDDNDKITEYCDSPFQGVKYVSAGIYGLDTSALPVLDRCIEENVKRMRNFQRALITNNLNLKAFNLGKVIDVDHLSDIEKAHNFLSN